MLSRLGLQARITNYAAAVRVTSQTLLDLSVPVAHGVAGGVHLVDHPICQTRVASSEGRLAALRHSAIATLPRRRHRG